MSPSPQRVNLKEKHPDWTGLQWRDYIERRDMLKTQLDIRKVAHVMGGLDRQDGDPTKWKLPNGSNFWFKPNTQGWKDLNQDRGGQGAVALVEWVVDDIQDEEDAVNWLTERFIGPDGKLLEGTSVDPSTMQVSEKAPFVAPLNYKHDIEEVFNYLTLERGIPPSLVQSEIDAGHLYATRRDVSLSENAPDEFDGDGNLIERVVQPGQRQRGTGNMKVHCVFISRTAGELRCVEKNGFKGTAPGSQSDHSGYKVPHRAPVTERIVGLTEAAVDAQAYSALFPGRTTVSTNGAYRFTLHMRLILDTMELPGYSARLAFDADDAGDQAAQMVFNAFYASKALAHHYGRDSEEFEDMFLEGALKPVVDLSPHTLFFGNGTGFKGGLPVHAKRVENWTDAANKKHITTHWEPTGELSNPMVVIQVNAAVGPFTQEQVGKQLRFKVSPKMYDYVVNELDLRRDRPMNAKDWDDELLMLGSAYVRAYERCAAAGWKDVPPLPPSLEALRDRSPLSVAPLPPLPPPATPPTSAPAPAPAASPPAVNATPTPVPASAPAVAPAQRRFQRPQANAPAPAVEPEPETRQPERRFRRSSP